MARVTVQDALDYCLVNPDGLSVEELLTKYPEYRAELQPLLALSMEIVTLAPPPVPLERRTAMKKRLMEAASAGALTVALVPRKIAAPAPRPWWESLAAFMRPAFAGAVGAVAVVALLWWSAAGSLPDNPLYGLKLTGEEAFRNFTSGRSGRIESYLGSAGARLNDIKEMQRRGDLAQAGPAIESYKSNIASGATLWEQTDGDERTDFAKRLYVSSAQGFLGLQAVAPDLANADERTRANFNEAIRVLEDVRAATGGTLAAASVDVRGLLLEADIEPSSLPDIASKTPTVAVPVIANATQTNIAAAQATGTARGAAADQTAVAIIAASGGTPSGRVNAARTVVAGGTGQGVVSAQQTVLAPAPSTETAAPRATSTLVLNPTATADIRQTAISTSTRVASTATSIIQPPTARPATSTPRPPQPTATRRATNTRILPRPTNIPIVATLVPRTIVPTSTQVPGATRPPSTPTVPPVIEPTPSRTPIPILTQLPTLPPLPTVTIEIPILPTIVRNTPMPTNTPVVPPTEPPATPLPIPTMTIGLPLPTLTSLPLPTLTPLPLPTEILCPLQLEEFGLSCGQGLCLGASALVHNASSSGVRATWTAELRVRLGVGNYITLSTQTGSEEFAPGDTPLEPSFCLPLPVGTTLVQIRLTLAYAGCPTQQNSGAMLPCLLP